MQAERDVSTSKFPKRLKIVALGTTQATGKTAFIERFVTGKFYSDHPTTIGAGISGKSIKVDGVPNTIFAGILDMSSRERDRDTWNSYIRGADGIIITYDMTNDHVARLEDVIRIVINEVMGHKFMLVQFGMPTFCEYCSNLLWIMEKGSVCQVCKYTCHKKCVNKTTTKCKGVQDNQLEPGFCDMEKLIVGLKHDSAKVDWDLHLQVLEVAENHGIPHLAASAKTGYNVDEAFQFLCRNIVEGGNTNSFRNVEPVEIQLLQNNEKVKKKKLLSTVKERTKPNLKLPKRYSQGPRRNVMDELQELGLQTSSDLEEVMTFGTYQCFWNRIFLVGQFAVGKSTLAKVLVGEEISDVRESTDGIWIYMGRAGMSIEDKQWIFLPKGNASIDTIDGMLLSLNLPSDKDTKDNTRTDEQREDTKDTIGDMPGGPESNASHEEYCISPETSLDVVGEGPEQTNDGKSKLDGSKLPSGQADSSMATKPSQFLAMIKENMAKSSTLGKINTLIVDAIREGKYKQRIVPFDIWDFGGQKEFYMTHQLFITNRGVFVLMFNGAKDLRVDMPSMQEPFYKNTSEAVYLLHWVNCILTYCPKMENGFPRIILVATHKDKIALTKRKAHRQKLQKSLEELFKSHSGKIHLEIDPLIFINANDPTDPEIEVLRKRLIDRAFDHPRWGEEMPTAWVPLELMIAEKVEEGINVITREEMKALNERNEVLVLSDPQLEAFLRVQHSLGKILYFDDANLRNHIIINPVFLVDVLRSLVTEQQFWSKDELLKNILEKLLSTGTILRNDIVLLWNQKHFRPFLKHTNYLLDMLVHLDILVSPLSYQDESLMTSDRDLNQEPSYIVPCMIKKTDDTNYLKTKCLNKTSIVMSYVFKGEVIPPAIGFRFLASFISMYQIKTFQGRHMLFSDLVVVEVDQDHDVVVQIKGKQVVVYLVHSTDVRNIEPTLASSVQECLTASINRISEFYVGLSKRREETEVDAQESSLPFEIHFGVICVGWFRKTICFFPHSQMPSTGDKTWRCDHGTVHSVNELSMWFAEKVPAKHCPRDCKGLGQLELEQCPLDTHLRRLAASISPSKCKEVVISLGLPVNTWDNLEYQFQHQNPDDLKFMALHRWKQENPLASFQKVAKALLECELSDHYLCNVLRDIKLPEEYTDEQLAAQPTSYFLHHVANHIGDSSMQLAIELGLGSSEIDEIRYQYKNKLLNQTREIIRKWQNERNGAINKNLLKALIRIGKANCLKGIKIK